jgi:hypothetical protein
LLVGVWGRRSRASDDAQGRQRGVARAPGLWTPDPGSDSIVAGGPGRGGWAHGSRMGAARRAGARQALGEGDFPA